MAWKRSDDLPGHPAEPAPAAPRPTPSPSASSTSAPEPPRRSGDRATIGPSIFIKGDLTGDEDLVIEGRVEGRVDLKQNNVTIGHNGKVKADVFGRVVTIEGEVDGNVFAQEQAVLRQAGAIRGNISAPRVVLEDGSRFKGTIDMEPKERHGTGTGHQAPGPQAAQTAQASAPSRIGAADAGSAGESPVGASRPAQAG
ncbi:MAG TPA: polymer-forming cytoskeletal protein [Thermoanaerobaculia bacterium]|jgi:cytoskeletal protein CcmA (bactofilin family)|nr:polymer-forming cytoskeletal protein [Thermoanaerobaculia bacterium]